MLTYIKKSLERQQQKLKKYQKDVDQINGLEPVMEKLSNEELRNKTSYLKEQLKSGKTIEEIKVEAFAVVREASKRVLGLRHFDVQLMGGLALAEGNISEMATGEGKTLVATLPSYLRALEEKGVHVITVNEYLAARDKEKMGKVHEFLGLQVGLNTSELSPLQKKQAYEADITYGVGNEFGFDFLRDHMVYDKKERVQRPFHYAIIDEVDSILLDEAKTPLIIAGKTGVSSHLFHVCAKLIKRFTEEEDYEFDIETKAVNLTESGITKVEKAFGIENLYDLEHHTLYRYMIQSLRAHIMLERDVDYIVSKGEIQLIDQFTGRILEGRSFSDGLQQALEAKEGLEVTEENKTQASITIQNYFRMYPILSGMTGTAKTDEKEFQQVYNMDVVSIPTNKTKLRNDLDCNIYLTKACKYKAVTKEVKMRHEMGQPVLIGTTSIQQSEMVAKFLNEANLPYHLLNAKSEEKEAELISLAGQKGQITIATNMAGRGTDILLGEGVHELGGLCVIGTERHESRRIDNQLKGRAGRQGDPGLSQFFISIEDDMINRYASEEIEKLEKSIKTDKDGLILNRKILDFYDKIQRICEGSNYSMREYTLNLDEVVNAQREIVYELRNRVLKSEDMISIVNSMYEDVINIVVERACPLHLLPEEWDTHLLHEQLIELFPHTNFNLHREFESSEDVKNSIMQSANDYKDLTSSLLEDSELQYYLKVNLLHNIDHNWTEHLDIMSRLKEGIGLRSYSQEDPKRLYEKEGFELFTTTYSQIQTKAIQALAHLVNKKRAS